MQEVEATAADGLKGNLETYLLMFGDRSRFYILYIKSFYIMT